MLSLLPWLTIAAPSREQAVLLPGRPLEGLKLARRAWMEPDARTARRSTAFLGPVLPSNCKPDHQPSNSVSWVVNGLPGGGYSRCYSAVAPKVHTRRLPVVIWLTGVGGDGERCGTCCNDEDGNDSFGSLATNVSFTGGFALVCPEPLRFNGSGHVWHSEMWDIPQPISPVLGQRCSASRDYDLILALLDELSTRPQLDLSNLYVLGESLGGAAAAFWTVCIQEALAAYG
ncbi:MAG: hypothetical protein SGPRY_009085, partial [Prymnesium sp.]